VSRIADNVVYLGNQREGSRMLREMRVLKTRGSAHDHDIHRIEIDATGFHVVDGVR
jgi:KaiC/GvpD/RAD55 family RecA-like ATPase